MTYSIKINELGEVRKTAQNCTASNDPKLHTAQPLYRAVQLCGSQICSLIRTRKWALFDLMATYFASAPPDRMSDEGSTNDKGAADTSRRLCGMHRGGELA